MKRRGAGMTVALMVVVAACEDGQSVLAPRGPHAEQVSLLAWIMFFGAAAILLLVLSATAVALFAPTARRRWLGREAIIVGGGIVFPVVTLTALLVYGLALTRAGDSALPDGEPLRISVVGEQWWWRVTYTNGADEPFASANEIRVPTGRTIELTLTTADVIHSFWVPHFAGKLDMIPGRANRLHFVASAPGVSRGQCAEYCGGAHALMSLYVVALAPEDFEAWRQREAALAAAPETDTARRGQTLFLTSGCIACHTIRGTEATGAIGPDLTHVGSRLSLAAATLGNDEPALRRWIADNQHIKPENRMPPFRIFSAVELGALAAYLASLK